jgi:hypothetical protein
MAITVNLPPEAEAILIERAVAEGLGIDAYVQLLLQKRDLKVPSRLLLIRASNANHNLRERRNFE